ncbi:MAG: hypothetical protein KZQ60_08885 [Candidatus Thiodiazotropha sp. (ex Lucinoma aequizonata)]|nr:hypothetical protein [Candidatus Thiodiazotropha sp. (ex Lucinoma aequizonata)]
MHYSIMTTAMTLRRLGCALCMPFIALFRSPFRPYNRAYAYRGLTAFALLSMAVSDGDQPATQLITKIAERHDQYADQCQGAQGEAVETP